MTSLIFRKYLSVLIVFAMTATGLWATGADEEEPEAAADKEIVLDALGRMVEKPQYGGWSVDTTRGIASPDWNPLTADWFAPQLTLSYELPYQIDWARGPAGSGDLDFSSMALVVENLTGNVAESWERPDPNRVIYHIRQGVHFWDKPPANGREMDAHDLVYTYKAMAEHPRSAMFGSTNTFTALDKWTVEVTWGVADATSWTFNQTSQRVNPRELADAGLDMDDFRNAIGTGPFIPVNHVPGSLIEFERNPGYWGHDPLHPDNQLPYLDGVRLLELADESAKLAALRTGKIDRWVQNANAVPWTAVAGLVETSPQLQYTKASGKVRSFPMRVDQPPFDDKRVRHAVMLAINHEEVARDFYQGTGDVVHVPAAPSHAPYYVPLEELPDNLQELFGYDPDKARQLLAEAGYPDGFEVELHTSDQFKEWTELYLPYLADVGIDAELILTDQGTHEGKTHVANYDGIAAGSTGWPILGSTWWWAGHIIQEIIPWQGHVADPVFRGMYEDLTSTQDPDEYLKKYREMFVYTIDQTWWANLVMEYEYAFWQPWIKNYHGETDFWQAYPPLKYVWVDHDLKLAMSGRSGRE